MGTTWACSSPRTTAGTCYSRSHYPARQRKGAEQRFQLPREAQCKEQEASERGHAQQQLLFVGVTLSPRLSSGCFRAQQARITGTPWRTGSSQHTNVAESPEPRRITACLTKKQECTREGNRRIYSLANVILICKLLIVEAKLVNKIGRHLLHLIIRKGLAAPGPVTVI